jgi:hypothetical protein
MDNESILLGIQPDFRNVDQGSISSYIFLSDNARPCIHTPYAFCYRPRPSCDFFLVLCIGYRRSISDHGGLSSERQIIPCPDCTEPFQITESLEDRVYYAALLHV